MGLPAGGANPLHPGLPPDQGKEAQADNPPADPKSGGEGGEEFSENYLRNLTGGRYKTAKAVWDAKQETDRKYHELAGELRAVKEQVQGMQYQSANPAVKPEEALRERLEEAGISPDVVGVFREIAQDVVVQTLTPLAQSQKERARVLGSNPNWAAAESEMFQFLAQHPDEDRIFQQIHATSPEAAYKYGMRGLAENKADQAFNEPGEGAPSERSRELTHGQVIGQKHRASEATIRGDMTIDKTKREADLLKAESIPGSRYDEYSRSRLDFIENQHPDLKALLEEQRRRRG